MSTRSEHERQTWAGSPWAPEHSPAFADALEQARRAREDRWELTDRRVALERVLTEDALAAARAAFTGETDCHQVEAHLAVLVGARDEAAAASPQAERDRDVAARRCEEAERDWRAARTTAAMNAAELARRRAGDDLAAAERMLAGERHRFDTADRELQAFRGRLLTLPGRRITAHSALGEACHRAAVLVVETLRAAHDAGTALDAGQVGLPPALVAEIRDAAARVVALGEPSRAFGQLEVLSRSLEDRAAQIEADHFTALAEDARRDRLAGRG